MPVRRATAYRLLKSFGLLEFELKRISGFVGIGRGGFAKVGWPTVEASLRQLPARDFLDRVSTDSRAKLLGGARNRPMVQMVEEVHGSKFVRFEVRNLPNDDAEALLVATRRVRNNLFHGGKEDPLEEPYLGDDQEWATAAAEVTELLLDSVRNGSLRP